MGQQFRRSVDGCQAGGATADVGHRSPAAHGILFHPGNDFLQGNGRFGIFQDQPPFRQEVAIYFFGQFLGSGLVGVTHQGEIQGRRQVEDLGAEQLRKPRGVPTNLVLQAGKEVLSPLLIADIIGVAIEPPTNQGGHGISGRDDLIVEILVPTQGRRPDPSRRTHKPRWRKSKKRSSICCTRPWAAVSQAGSKSVSKRSMRLLARIA